MEDSYKANDEEFKKLNINNKPNEYENKEELQEESENIIIKQTYIINKILYQIK